MLLKLVTLLAAGRVAVGFDTGTRLAQTLRVRVEPSSPLDLSSAQFLQCAPPTDSTAGDLAIQLALALTSPMGKFDIKWFMRAPIQALVHLALSAIRNGYVAGVSAFCHSSSAGNGPLPQAHHQPAVGPSLSCPATATRSRA